MGGKEGPTKEAQANQQAHDRRRDTLEALNELYNAIAKGAVDVAVCNHNSARTWRGGPSEWLTVIVTPVEAFEEAPEAESDWPEVSTFPDQEPPASP